MILDTYEIDPSPMASAQQKFFAEQEAQEGGRFDVDDYEYLQSLALSRDSLLAREAYNRSFDL
ncbi:hypothetical protein STIP28_20 [Synechococcus T7-like virus S-TIP28]|uniref:Uncharacterized protein n=1 Tax=Synechococcus T7-like virus S-TIP28 TaxID=1332140 RepID=A0AAE9BP11_9CAUD|nr:hypothetical protein STIP28_20 [Synechococcus T7-like virus S-TIP28]